MNERVLAALDGAAGVAWDGCHKVYILAAPETVAYMRDLDYPHVVVRGAVPDGVLYEVVSDWWDRSCGLRFVDAVAPAGGKPAGVFTAVIGQGDDW